MAVLGTRFLLDAMNTLMRPFRSVFRQMIG